MFHKPVKLEFKEGTLLELTFRTGEVMQFDMSTMFEVYPPAEALKDRKLFTSGKLLGYGIVWNDDLDIETETVYEEGTLVRTVDLPGDMGVAEAVLSARASVGMSQKELANVTGIDQSDISRIERGMANPSVLTLRRLADGLGMELSVSFKGISHG